MKVEFEAVLEEAISPYHTVKAVTAQLERFGFRRFDAGSGAAPNPGGKYYATRGGKSVAAWVQPAAGAPQDLRLVTAHTDFPALKVKPNSFHTRDNCALIELDVYDGAGRRLLGRSRVALRRQAVPQDRLRARRVSRRARRRCLVGLSQWPRISRRKATRRRRPKA